MIESAGDRAIDHDHRPTGRLVDGRAVTVHVVGDVISSIEPAAPAPSDSGDQQGLPWLLPGLVDLQVNGWAGADVNAAEPSPAIVRTLADALARLGTTRFLPTVITAAPETMINRIAAIATAVRDDPLTAAAVAGVHVEGPYLSAVDGARGAHEVQWMRDPDPAEVDAWITAADGLLRMVTLAPERPGTRAIIDRLTDAGVRVALGHTAAEPAVIREAAARGASVSTHLGNGAPAVLPRHPNLLWAQLADDRLTAGLITDGHHLPAETVTAMIRAKGEGGSFLVSDAVALAGRPPGVYVTPVGGTVEVTDDGALRLPDSGLLAGSGACLLDCLRWAARATPIAPEQLVAMATTVPAGLLDPAASGLVERSLAEGSLAEGRLVAGARADVLALEPAPDLRTALATSPVREILVAGRRIG